MLKFVILASLFCSTFSFAQGMSIEMDANRLAQEINQNGRYLAPEQRAQISDGIQALRGVLYGASRPMPNQFTCVSRDNNGFSPYVIGVRSGINVSRIEGSTIRDLTECQNNIQSFRNAAGVSIACFSRDNNGFAPYVMSLLDGSGHAIKVDKSLTRGADECKTLVQNLKINFTNAVYCTSRDNNGFAPYVAASLDLRSGQVATGTEVFREFADCSQFLGTR